MSKKLFLSYKKIAIFLSIICMFTVGFSFRHVLLKRSVEFWLGYKYPMKGGWQFQYEKAGFSKEGFALQNVSIATRKPNILLKTSKAKLFPKHRGKLSFDFEVDLYRPNVTLHKTKGPSLLSPKDILGFLDGHIRFSIEEGKLSFIDQNEVIDVYFALWQDEVGSSLGTLYLSDKGSVRQEAALMLKLYRWPSEWIFELEAEDSKLAWICNLCRFFQSEKQDLPHIEKGVLNGQGWVGWKDHVGISQITSNFSISSLKAKDSVGELSFVIDDLEVDLSYPNKRMGSSKDRSFLQNISMKSQIEGASVRFQDDSNQTEFAIIDLAGEMAFNSFRDSKLKLKGLLEQKGQTSPIVLSGSPSVTSRDTLDIDLKFLLGPEFPYSTEMSVSLGLDANEGMIARGKLKDLGPAQVSMMQHLIGFSYPDIKDFEFCQGLLNFEASMRMAKGKIQKVFIDRIDSENLEIYWKSQDILGVCSSLSGSAQLDLDALPKFKFPLWDIAISHGDLVMGGKDAEAKSLSDINMKIHMCRDVFEPSSISLVYEGVKAKLDMVGYYTEADYNITLESTGDRILSFFSEDQVAQKLLKKYECQLLASLKYKLTDWDIEGKARLQTQDEALDEIAFGFLASDTILELFEKNPREVIEGAISKGWFSAENISTNLSNFFKGFLEEDWNLNGNLSLSGQFDCFQINADISSSDLQFLSPSVDVILGEGEKISHGHFSYDIKTKRLLGHLPLYHAKCLEKSMNVWYQDIKADLFIDDRLIALDHIQTKAEGLTLGGRLSIDFVEPLLPKLWIETSHIEGNTDALEKYIKHLDKLKDIKIPFTGNILGKEHSFSFIYHLGEEIQEPIWNLKVRLNDGSYQISPDVVLKDLCFDLQYDHKLKKADMYSLKAILPSQFYPDGYTLSSPKVTCDFKDNTPRLAFHVTLQDSMLDLVDVIGSANLASGEVIIDPTNSHLLNNPIKKCTATFHEDYTLKTLAVELPVDVANIRNYGRLFSDFGGVEGVSNLTESIWSGYKGIVDIRLDYRDFIYSIIADGKEISLGGKDFGEFSCELMKKNEQIELINFSSSDIVAKGLVTYQDELWKIDHLQIDKPGSEIFFAGGNFSVSDQMVSLHLKEAEIDLNTFFKVDGRARLDGEVMCIFQSKKPFFTITADLNFTCEGFSRENYFLRSNDLMHLTYRPDQGLKIQDTAFSLESIDDEFSLSCQVPTALIDLERGICQGYRLHFTLSDKVYAVLQKHSEQYNALPKELPYREDQDLEVFLDIHYTPEKITLHGKLPEGTYVYKDYQQKIRELLFDYDQKYLQLDVLFPLLSEELKAKVKIKTEGAWDTEIRAWQTTDREIVNLEKHALCMDLSLKTSEGVIVKGCRGEIFGLGFSFLPKHKMQDDHFVKLIGSLDINAKKLMPILPEEVAALVRKLSFYKGMRLSGELNIDKIDWQNSTFLGFLEGKDFDFGGNLFKTLLAEIQIDPRQIEITNLKVSDEAARAEIPEMRFYEDKKKSWQLKVPEIIVTDLRPSLLKTREKSNQSIKPFFIEKLTLQDISGALDDVNTLTGKGAMSFVNTFKRDHNLLDVPIEIISRIGLDMVLLVPIQGEMEYQLKDGKLVFTKLKNSFSENKRSYFYLWNKTESFVDFDGNVYIDIRMKQHVLLRFTQLFILNVSGSLNSPSFTLR